MSSGETIHRKRPWPPVRPVLRGSAHALNRSLQPTKRAFAEGHELWYPRPGDVPEAISEQRARIVGREAELAMLDALLETVGSPLAFVLAGAPGIGKTSLWESGIAAARQ